MREYASLEEYRVDYEARMKDGRFALIAGAPRPELDLTKPHRRVGQNFVDTASTCLGVDFDGLEPDDANAPIDGPGAYSDAEGACLRRTEAIAEGIHARRVHGVCDLVVPA